VAILVSDTSIIIDLERGSLLDDLFGLPMEFAVPDLLFERELRGELGDRLLDLGLRVEELDPTELSRATAVTREHKRLSTADTFAFAIAESRGWGLLTGDGGLRTLADANAVEVHGVLWICDQMETASVPRPRLHSGLTAISAHPRCRLPPDEVATRLARYSPPP
jgi:hypothetical protein